MRLELTTYALRKRDRDGASDELKGVYGESESVVAGMVAFRTSDNTCESVPPLDDSVRLIDALPADLAAVVRGWGNLSEDARKSVVAIVESLART
ncbi:MAG: hypothetical protein O3B13_24770 [Planctomycetota bacterium]|nr:hypothetical protein [Planctomycetota bacterium]